MNPCIGSHEIAVEIRHLFDSPMDVQADERWSHVGKKKNRRWLRYAIGTVTGCVLSFVFGRRQDTACGQLTSNLKAFNIRTYYTDDWASYSAFLPKDKHVIGKRHTQKIEKKPFISNPDQTIDTQNDLFLKIGSTSRYGNRIVYK